MKVRIFMEAKEGDILEFKVDIFTIGEDWKGKFDDLNNSKSSIYLE